jgi:hypothetical protein
MKYDLIITGTFFDGQHNISVDAGDVGGFLSSIRSACGLDGAEVSIQYEDPDFNEWCEVDDLDDLAEGSVTIRLKAPAGTVLNMAAPAAGPAPAPAPAAADLADPDEFTGPTILETTKSIDFSSRDIEQFAPVGASAAPAAPAPAPPAMAAVPEQPGGRQLQLTMTDSTQWCADGTVCPVICADLAGLSVAIGRQLGLTGVKVEIFDEDFEEWCGAATLDEVPDRATVRIKATGRGAAVPEGVPPSAQPARAAPAAAPPPTATAPGGAGRTALSAEAARLQAEKEELLRRQKGIAEQRSQMTTNALQQVYKKETRVVAEGRAAIDEKRQQLGEMRSALSAKRQEMGGAALTLAPEPESERDILAQMAQVGALLEESVQAGKAASPSAGGVAQERVAISNFLQKVPLFSGLSERDFGRLSDVCSGGEKLFRKGEFIIKQGDSGEEFYLLISGTAIATIDVPGMKPATVKHYYKGDYFGELALMRADSKRAANVVATSEEATCLAISRSDFQNLTQVNTGPAATFTETEEDEMMLAAMADDDDLMAIAGDLSSTGPGAPAGPGSYQAPAPAPAPASRPTGSTRPTGQPSTAEEQELSRTVNERRQGMFDDVGDQDELVRKEALVSKIDLWLSEIGIGGNQMRGFDPSEIVKFAWEHCLEDVDCDGIYRLFVEHQSAEAKVRMSQAMGFEGVDMSQFSGMPASEMDAFAIRSGWLAHEIGDSKLRHKFTRHWFALWHDPASPAEDLMLLIYEGPDSVQPYGVIALQQDKFSVEPPKTPRKSHPHSFRISVQPPAGSDEKPAKYVLAADTEMEFIEWQTALRPKKAMSRAEKKQAQRAEAQKTSQAMEMLAHRFLTEGKMKVLASTAASLLDGTAVRAGWLRKEVKKGVFKRRWIVLWRHPQAKHSNDYLLLHYESPDSPEPEGIMTLSPGRYHVGAPKSKRKGYDLVFRVDGTKYAGPGYNPKMVFAADEEIDYRGWTIAFDDLFTGQKDDMQELAQRFLDEGMFKVLASTEATRLQATALKTGWVKEEVKKGQWVERWLVLWRHPQAKDTNDYLLLKYVEPFGTPEGFLTLTAGQMHAMPPKSKRKDQDWCWRVDGTRSSIAGE